MKLGSLFDGSGGFPLAGVLCGIEPVWASEVEPYPIAATRERFPKMKHLGDISKINGGEIEPVDIITFGSPCQDLSVAGKRAGLKHEANGDEETTRSGLFMEAVRIIKEMRNATNGQYPTFALWENVPGAFSSNMGEDFRIVCEELIKIVEPSAVMPPVPQNGWNYADSYIGDGWSLAYRVFDAQYWGVPQRRRRIHLVADFRGECAREILFERDGLRGYFAEGRTSWQTTPEDAQRSVGADDREGENAVPYTLEPGIAAREGGHIYEGVSGTLRANMGDNQMSVAYTLKIRSGCGGGEKGALVQTDKSATLATNNDQYLFQPVVYDGSGITSPINASSPQPGDPCHTLSTDSRNLLVEPVYCLQGNGIDRADTAGCNGKGWREDASYTLNTIDRPAVVYAVDQGGGKSGANVLENKTPTLTCTHGGEPAVAYKEVFRQGGFADYVEGEVGTLKASGGDLGGGSENLITAMLANGEKTADTLCAGPAVRGFSGNQEIMRGSFHVIGSHPPRYIVRRLTPTECARLQGFADAWGHIKQKDNLTEEEYRFWLEARNTHASINGKETKDYTKAQMLTWYNKLWTDSAEYKMWGNGIALPPALYCMQGIVEAMEKEEAV